MAERYKFKKGVVKVHLKKEQDSVYFNDEEKIGLNKICNAFRKEFIKARDVKKELLVTKLPNHFEGFKDKTYKEMLFLDSVIDEVFYFYGVAINNGWNFESEPNNRNFVMSVLGRLHVDIENLMNQKKDDELKFGDAISLIEKERKEFADRLGKITYEQKNDVKIKDEIEKDLARNTMIGHMVNVRNRTHLEIEIYKKILKELEKSLNVLEISKEDMGKILESAEKHHNVTAYIDNDGKENKKVELKD